MDTFRTIGIMSGTSMDGADIVLVDFSADNGQWHTKVVTGHTMAYPTLWQQRLPVLAEQPATVLARWGVEWSLLIADEIHRLLATVPGEAPLLIGCHGHTVAHRPQEGWTLQLGDGATLAARTGIPLVNDFRQGDMAAGGQGAPLVPLGDLLLFPHIRYCLNLGGIANISCKSAGQIVGGDLTGCNTLLNKLAQQQGHAYDKDGALSAAGRADNTLLQELLGWDFLQRPIPKSLDTSDVLVHQWQLLQASSLSDADKAATVCAAIGKIIGQFILQQEALPGDQLLITGGGCHHPVLMDAIRMSVPCKVVTPEPVWIDQKEAIIFAFLGLRRWLGQTTALASVTGATHDTVTGALHLPHVSKI